RTSEDEAIRRLFEVAQEAGGKRNFVEICGWPALEREYQIRRPQVAERRGEDFPEPPIVEEATVAIAQAHTMIRFEATLKPGVGAEGTAPIFGAIRTISCPKNINPNTTKSTIE